MAGGDEYERIDQIKQTNAKFILPVNFPKPYDAEDPYLIKKISLGEMRQWAQKPTIQNFLVIRKFHLPLLCLDSNLTKNF